MIRKKFSGQFIQKNKNEVFFPGRDFSFPELVFKEAYQKVLHILQSSILPEEEKKILHPVFS